MGGRAATIGLAAALAVMNATGVWAADKPVYASPPSWVHDVPIDTAFKPSGAAIDVLLLNQQQRLTPGADETFVETASRVNAPEGLARLGNLMEAWDPSTQSLTIHRARILREGKIIDLLADGKTFTVIRRETNLEAAVVDGQLTATLQPEGLRVGDTVDLAVSYTRREPALGDHSVGAVFTGSASLIHHVVIRSSWLKSHTPRVFESDDLPRFIRTEAGDRVELGFEETDAVRPEPPKRAPPFETLLGFAMLSDFASWEDVSRTVYPLFDKAAALAPGSPLKAEIARIAAAHPDAKGRTLAALELVESNIHYLAVLLNAGGYTPAPVDLTWSRRFGDCKGKTVLLLALLRGLGVEATPALVHTSGGDGLDRIPATMDIFDHVILRVSLDGRIYWLDGTRQGDEDLDILPIPNFHFALPLTSAGAPLERLTPKDPALPMGETRLKVDLTGGMNVPAKVTREVILRGDIALFIDLALKGADPTARDRSLRELLADEDWMKPSKLGFTYDPKTMTFVGTLNGEGTPPFTTPDNDPSTLRDWEPAPDFVRISSDLRRTSDYHRDAPYAVDYPSSTRDTVEVILPNGGKGFSLNNGGTVRRDAGAVAYSRTATINGEHFFEIESRHALRPTFPASEAAATQTSLKNIGGYEVGLRYEVVKTPAPAAMTPRPAEPSPTPATASSDVVADSAESRAEDAYAARDFAAADLEYGKAIKAHSTAKLFYNRAVARAALGNIAGTEEDLKQSLALDSREPMALFALGQIALTRSDASEAARRFATALDSAPDKATMARRIARSYGIAKRNADAVPYWDRAVEADTGTNRQKAEDLASDCWTRTRMGLDIQKAHGMCEQSLTIAPGVVTNLNLAGFSDIRLGDFKGAVARFDQALAISPGSSDARFGRSIAERKLGQIEKADADRDSAIAADPNVAVGTETFTSP